MTGRQRNYWIKLLVLQKKNADTTLKDVLSGLPVLYDSLDSCTIIDKFYKLLNQWDKIEKFKPDVTERTTLLAVHRLVEIQFMEYRSFDWIPDLDYTSFDC